MIEKGKTSGVARHCFDFFRFKRHLASCKILYILLTKLAHMACMQVLAQSGLHL